MFVFHQELRELAETPELYHDSIRVLKGTFTDEADKARLVPTILGLWAAVLRNRRTGDDSFGVYELVKLSKADVFPPEYFGSLIDRLEQRVEAETEEAEEMQGVEAEQDSIRIKVLERLSDTKSESGMSGGSELTSASPGSALWRSTTSRKLNRHDANLFKAFKAAQSVTATTPSSSSLPRSRRTSHEGSDQATAQMWRNELRLPEKELPLAGFKRSSKQVMISPTPTTLPLS